MLKNIIKYALTPLILLWPIFGKAEDISYNGMWTKFRVFQSPKEVIEESKLSFSSNGALISSTLLELGLRQFEQVENIPKKDNYVLITRSSIEGSEQILIIAATSSALYLKEGATWLKYSLTELDRVKIHCTVGELYLEEYGDKVFSKLEMFNSHRGFQYFENCTNKDSKK